MRVSKLIEKLEAYKSLEGDVEVFLAVGESEGQVKSVMVGKAEHMVDEEVFLGTGVEDYHQVIVIDG